MVDLDFEEKNPEKAKIRDRRNSIQKPLLVILPLDPRVSDDLDKTIPIIGFGLVIPEVENEVKVEYAARIIEDEDDYQQEDDDLEDYEE